MKTKLSPGLSYSQVRSAHGLFGMARLSLTRIFYRRQPRWLKRRVVRFLSRLVSDLLFPLALLTSEDPEFEHLHRHACAAIKAGETILCGPGGFCALDNPGDRA